VDKQTHEVFHPTTLSSKRNLMYIVYCCNWLRRFEDEAFEEVAPVRHMRKVSLFHLFLCTLGLPYLYSVKLTPPSGPALGRHDNT